MSASAPSPAPFNPNAGDQHQRRRKGWRYLVGIGLVGLIIAGLWPSPLPVETTAVTRGPLVVTVNEEGVTQVRHRYVISSPVSGHLRRIDLKPGAEVVAGQTVLAVLEPATGDILDARSRAQAEARARAVASQVSQAEANRSRAAAAYELARTEAERQRTLARDRLVSPQELDVAENRERTAAQEDRAATFALQVTRYELEQAEAALQQAQPHGTDSEASMPIMSPVSGRVLRVFQESARIVTGGTALLEVGDPTNLEVRIEVLSRDGVAVAPGAKVWLDQWGGPTPLEARVRLVEPAAFTKISALGVEEQRVNVLADLVTPADERPNLGDGFRVEARIERNRRDDTLWVAASALFQRDGTWTTFVFDDGVARERAVEVGLSNGVQTEIRHGLAAGDLAIAYPGDRVADGSRVKPLE